MSTEAGLAGQKRRARKAAYKGKFETLLKDYKDVMIIKIDNVGSQQMQQVRKALRGKAVLVMGKNTLMRKIIRDLVETTKNDKLENLSELIRENIGLVFTAGDAREIRDVITQFKVPAAAKSGTLAPSDVWIQPGPTGLDPGQTGFFQALNIPTKIVKGSIEIQNPVHLIKANEKVTSSHVALLSKLDQKPFFYGIKVTHIYEDGSVYPSNVLDITADSIIAKFTRSVSQITALSLRVGLPSALTIPHSIGGAFRKLMGLALGSGNTNFKQADAMLKAAETAKSAPAPSAKTEEKKDDKKDAKKEPEKAKEPEKTEEEDDVGGGMGGLFGDD
jgi:large subunit ribosomal protein LP0